MGELRNRLERRGKVWRPEGYPSITGHQLGILLKMWFHSKGRVDYKLKHPKWPWQRGKPDADYRGTGYALTPMGWHLCKRIVTAFPREAAEAEAEAAAYFRMFKGEAA
jgi:hypothetical protein